MRLTRSRLFLIALLAGSTGAVIGAGIHRYYQLTGHNHWLKSAVRYAKNETHDHGDRPLTPLQSWHIETAEAISFIRPADATWLIRFNRNSWSKSDNLNFLYLASAIRDTGRVEVSISSEHQQALTLDDFRAFNAVHRNVVVRFIFPGPVPTLPALKHFGDTGFHLSLAPRASGRTLAVRLLTHPVLVDEMAENTNTPESLDQRGQIAHYFILIALEIYAWANGLDPQTLPGPRIIMAVDGNSARNHAVINRTAQLVRERLGEVSPHRPR